MRLCFDLVVMSLTIMESMLHFAALALAKGHKVECGECWKLLRVGLLASYQVKQHDIYRSFVLEEDGESAPPSSRRWDATFFSTEKCYRCPVPG